LRTEVPKIGISVWLVKPGDHLTSLGSFEKFSTKGKVKGLEEVDDEEKRKILMVAATYESRRGDSGAPVFSAHTGNMVGMHSKGGMRGGNSNYFLRFSESIGAVLNGSIKYNQQLAIIERAKNSFLGAEVGTSTPGVRGSQ